MEKYLWKGIIVDKEDITIDLHDRGYNFGDGLYEVVRVYNGKFFTLDEHLQRLMKGAQEIMMNLVYSADEIKQMLTELAHANHLSDGYVYMQITRGDGVVRNHGFSFYQDQSPVISGYVSHTKRNVHDLTHGTKGITVPDRRWNFCHVKSLNLLLNVLAQHTAQQKNVSKAIFVRDLIVTEEKSSNVIMVKNGVLYTHPDGSHILPGITKLVIKQIAVENSIPYIETPFFAADLYTADEILITSTTNECSALIELDGQPVNDGKIGPVARLIQEKYEAKIIASCGALQKDPNEQQSVS